MRSVAAFLVLVLIWTAGLVAFAGRIQQSTPAPTPQRADGIVVLTGQGARERMAAGVALLTDNYGRRVLVSGVNRDLTREDIRTATTAVKRLYDCCVDMRFNSLIVVTADYHMPRAMLELRAVAGRQGVALQPYPVATSAFNARRWWRSPTATRLLVMEYCKYLAILGRELVLSLGPKDHGPKDHNPAAAPQKG
jgi:uncharacterized SAM-binding protein YcdF (DUF218 family)